MEFSFYKVLIRSRNIIPAGTDQGDAAVRGRIEDLAGKTDETILDDTSSEGHLAGVLKEEKRGMRRLI